VAVRESFAPLTFGQGKDMRLWSELFGSWIGILSLLTIFIVIGMAVFLVRLFVAKSGEGPKEG
jgi:hypothetical protein